MKQKCAEWTFPLGAALLQQNRQDLPYIRSCLHSEGHADVPHHRPKGASCADAGQGPTVLHQASWHPRALPSTAKKKKTPSLTSPKPASGALGMLGGVCNWDVSGRRSRRDLAPTSWMLTEDKLCACVCFLLTHPLVMVEDSVPPCC